MNRITGSIVALATPFQSDLNVDYAALRKLIDWHIEQGTDCISVVGTSGESPTVTPQEHREIIRVGVEQARGRISIMAGCGANSTHEAVAFAKFAASVGADCQLQVVPYYNKPTQEGLYQHFKAISEAVELPVVLYNVPKRTVVNMQSETTLRLAQLPGIVGIKDASAYFDQALEVIGSAPKGFSVYSGDDPTALALMLIGGHGNISVTANIAPRLMHEMCRAAVAGDRKTAFDLHQKLTPLNKALFSESSPIPLKWAMGRMGLCQPQLRLPLTPLSTAARPSLENTLKEAALI